MPNLSMAEKIKMRRQQLGLTLEQVADIVGVGKSTVRKWENGLIANMRRDKIANLAIALHTTPAYLMGWDDVPNSSELTDAELDAELVSLLTELTPDEIPLIVAYIQGIIAARNKGNDNK